ncbi:ABC transporter permease [Methanoplanus sp. FWC-SCC4]|uniref:ABC transporter permease n=1 Tax=Methanochimaera problematica TaxID=2609417 RepID=A0AA97I506_9EURY|nr:ABC transporter permease subunit [Methanoplanus sp. FWC-SCC4]WOF17009.1 ABC transporter permease [Methanoplanus sp. FWC-SCC4]
MKSNGLFVISRKEFRDHLMSRKFLMIFGIILIITIIGMAGGAVSYNEEIKEYNEHQAVAGDKQYSGYYGMFSPTVMTIFSNVGMLIVTLGAILGIAMGFDLITKEKESKSLKILLSHPIYRDEVINGKALGGLAALVLALLITFVISMALLLIFGILPNADEFMYILIFGAAVFLMIFSYFSISLFMSTVANDSGNALVYTLIVFILLSGLLPMLVMGPTMDLIIGKPPEYPDNIMMPMMSSSGSTSVSVSGDSKDASYESPFESDEWKRYEQEINDYWNKRQGVMDFINLLSPTNNFQYISNYITHPEWYQNKNEIMYSGEGMNFGDMSREKPGLLEILGDIFKNIIALIAIPAVFFGMAYVRFMRLDVR